MAGLARYEVVQQHFNLIHCFHQKSAISADPFLSEIYNVWYISHAFSNNLIMIKSDFRLLLPSLVTQSLWLLPLLFYNTTVMTMSVWPVLAKGVGSHILSVLNCLKRYADVLDIAFVVLVIFLFYFIFYFLDYNVILLFPKYNLYFF